MNARPLPVADRAAVLRQVRKMGKDQSRLLASTVLLYSCAVIGGLAGPFLLGQIVQGIQTGTTAGHLDWLVGILGVFLLIQTGFTRYGFRAAGRFAANALATLREEFVERVLALPLSTVENSGSGDLVTRASRDIDALRRALQMAVPECVVSVVTIALTVVAVLVVSPVLAVVLLVSIPPIAVVNRWYLRRSRAAFLREAAAASRITDSLSATVHGAGTVEAYGLEQQRIQTSDGDIENAYGALRYTLRLRSVLYPVEEVFFTVPVVASLLLGGYCYTKGWVNLGQVTAATLYIVQLMVPLEILLDWFGTLQSGGASLARVMGVADVPSDRTAGPESVQEPRELVAKDVRFAYDEGRDVLRELNLAVRPGERLAVVGPSGGGKSTLARLLTGIHGPRTGSVTLGGAPLTGLPLDDLRGEVALATQDHHVFEGTLRDNLLLAVRGTADDAALHTALETVLADDWVRALPEGLDTEVGSSGTELTASQAQQVALARLLLADPGILILDEATSLFNPGAARRLERSMAAVLEGRTVIAITHRLNAAHDADRVAVVEGGVITELGSHQELLDHGGTYAGLWSSWQ